VNKGFAGPAGSVLIIFLRIRNSFWL